VVAVHEYGTRPRWAWRGVTLDVRVPDGRPAGERMTMDAWYRYDDWRNPPGRVLFHRTRWRPPPGPRVEDATIRDYLEYVLAVAGWSYRVEMDKVVVYDPRARHGTDSEPPGGR